MKITAEIKKQALELAEKHGFSKLFVNKKGEFFTEECHASNSVGGKKDKYTEVSLSVPVVPEKGTTDLDKAADVIANIEAAADIEAVKAILDAEKNGKQRKSVFQAGEKKIESLSSKPAQANADEKTADAAAKLDKVIKESSESSKTDKE